MLNNNRIADEHNDRVQMNTLLFPICRVFFQEHPFESDIITGYDQAMDNLSSILCDDGALEYEVVIRKTWYKFRLRGSNVRIYSPDSEEAMKYSSQGYIPTPNIAISKRLNYSALIMCDIVYSLSKVVFSDDNVSETEIVENTLENAFIFSLPIPIGSKYCSLNHYSKELLQQLGEDFDSVKGCFVIERLLKHLVSVYRKPFNSPIILKNDYDNQMSRMEAIYTAGADYESSYYIIGSMMQPPKTRNKNNLAAVPDFIFSLQFNHKTMTAVSLINGKKAKDLINIVPINILFHALGCKDDTELLKYICPKLNDFGLIHTIRNAILQGAKHKEAYDKAQIDYQIVNNNIILDKPLDIMTARYIIGIQILNQETLNGYAKQYPDKNQFRANIAALVGEILDECLMPGFKVDKNRCKCCELGFLVRHLYLIGMGLEESQDKNSLLNKRIQSGAQIEREFKAFWNVRLRYISREIFQIISENFSESDISTSMSQKMPKIMQMCSNDMTNSFINSFKETSKENSKIRVDQVVPKSMNFVKGKLREIVITSSTQQKGSKVAWEHRMVHQADMFYVCPGHTPESGAQVGKYRMPTIYSCTTIYRKGEEELKWLREHKLFIQTANIDLACHYQIKLNGNIIGFVHEYDEVDTLYNDLLKARRNGIISRYTSIVVNHSQSILYIWTDCGRLMVPFVIVENCFDVSVNDSAKTSAKTSGGSSRTSGKGSSRTSSGKTSAKTSGGSRTTSGTVTIKPEFKKWIDQCSVDVGCLEIGLKNGFIELLCTSMAVENACIAPSIEMFYKKPTMYSHIALPQQINGMECTMIAGFNMNAGVRNAYESNQVKQAIGHVWKFPQLKYCGDSNTMLSPQVPLARTNAYQCTGMYKTPWGQNVIVAFMLYKYNQEDGIILNQDSVDNGLLKIASITNVLSEIKRDEEFRMPPNDIPLKCNPDSYGKLESSTCLPGRIGTEFYRNDVVIARISKIESKTIDSSVANIQSDGRFPITINTRPKRCVEINKVHGEDKGIKLLNLGQYRNAIEGDKFNSEQAQKGTVGKILPSEKIPYTASGIRPDIIFAPHAIFKRETFGHLYIPFIQKIAALLGCPIDCTPSHTQRTIEDLEKLAEEIGTPTDGLETLYDPDTGRPFKAFIGMHYWNRQSHLTEDKISVRNGGLRSPDTQQPVKGRKSGGYASTVDRMGTDTFNSAGINMLTRSNRLDQGSSLMVGVCLNCNCMKCYYHHRKHYWICPQCGQHPNIIPKRVPNASVLISQIFNALHVGIDVKE